LKIDKICVNFNLASLVLAQGEIDEQGESTRGEGARLAAGRRLAGRALVPVVGGRQALGQRRALADGELWPTAVSASSGWERNEGAWGGREPLQGGTTLDFVEEGREREHQGEEKTGGTINAIMAAVSREKRVGERRRKGRGCCYSVWGGEGLRGAEGPGQARLPER
jgi:hypothetical protein